MLLRLRQITGTNLAIGIVNFAFLSATGIACWQSWQSNQALERDLVSAAPQGTTESPRVPKLLTLTAPLEPDTVMDANAQHAPTGTWWRISEPAKITLQFDKQKLSGLYQTNEDGRDLLVSFVGDYRVGGENLLYGVIQEAGVRASDKSLSPGSLSRGAASPHDASRLIDQPFSARYELSESGLTIRDVKFAGSGLRVMEQPLERVFSHFVGGYARVPERS